jgi:gamma-glutamyltranspeptidase/glutathione hydrolase
MTYISDIAQRFLSRRVHEAGWRFGLGRRAVWGLALGLYVAGAPFAAAQRTQEAPEADTGRSGQSGPTLARHDMISSASPLASQAGRDILAAGGSAVDAAIAAQLVLGLVEPQSSGLGGGAFIVHWDNSRQALTSYDGRETAPAAAKPDRFLKSGKPMAFDKAVPSGLSVGVPGLVRLLELAHRKHGKLPWADLFKPAIKLARDGFAVTPRLHLLLRWVGADAFDRNARAYFFTPDGSVHAIGHVLRNEDYAATLERIAQHGAQGFYEGPIAEAIVAAVAKAPNMAGDMTLADVAGYAAKEREPVCVAYRGRRVCGMGPPSSGGITVGQTLMLLDGFDLGSGRAQAMRATALHLIAEAEKLAYADRGRYLADPDFVTIPSGLLDQGYLDERRRLIDRNAAMPEGQPGMPPGASQRAFGSDATLERSGTSHLSIIDRNGNAVGMTTTIEGAFGSGIFAAGFLLNNELTDFSFRPTDKDGAAIANRVEAGKRPRSSMSPTIVFGSDGRVQAVLGSPGGTRIILYVVKSLVALIDWQYDAQAAAALINFGSQGDTFEIETSVAAVGPVLSLTGYWHKLEFGLLNSGTHIVVRRPDGMLEGGADPRREGVALGN